MDAICAGYHPLHMTQNYLKSGLEIRELGLVQSGKAVGNETN